MTFDRPTSHSTTLNAEHMTAMCVTIQKQLGRVLLWSFCRLQSFIHSFVHSFILRTYMAPIQETLGICVGIVPRRMYRAMHDSHTIPWNLELTLCSGAKYPTRCNIRHWDAEVTQVR